MSLRTRNGERPPSFKFAIANIRLRLQEWRELHRPYHVYCIFWIG